MKTRRRPARPQAALLSDQLRLVIAGRGLSGYAVASAAGISATSLTRFLRRERGLTSESLDAVADALGLRLVEGRRGLRAGPAAGGRDGPGADRGALRPREDGEDRP